MVSSGYANAPEWNVICTLSLLFGFNFCANLFIHIVPSWGLTLRCQHPKALTYILKMEAACAFETLYSPVHVVITRMNIRWGRVELYVYL